MTSGYAYLLVLHTNGWTPAGAAWLVASETVAVYAGRIAFPKLPVQ